MKRTVCFETRVLSILLGFVMSASVGLAAEAENAGEKRLAGMKSTPSWVTRMASIHCCARYMGIDEPEAWIFGASGNAFAMNIFKGELCPSGPTAWPEEKSNALLANAGLRIKGIVANKKNPNAAERRKDMFKRVCAAIDASRPCVGWEMGVPEWYPICGYDKAGHYLYLNFDDKVHRKHHGKLGVSEIGVACVLILEPCKPVDDRTAVREALVLALDIAAGRCAWDRYAGGLAGYDEWIKALESGKSTDGLGPAYNAQCWAECRRNAAKFLELAAKRLADKGLDRDLDSADFCYRKVSGNLDAVAKLFPFDHRDRKAMNANWADKARRAKAAELLRDARVWERKGLISLAKIAKSLGADVDPDKLDLPK